MDISPNIANDILKCVRASAVPGGFARGPIVIGIASVLGDQLGESATGVSWRDDADRSNALLLVGGKAIHAVAPHEGEPHATVYTSAVSAVEAADVVDRQDSFAGGITWDVGTWHVTFRDGTVITLRSADATHGDRLAQFVRTNLLP